MFAASLAAAAGHDQCPSRGPELSLDQKVAALLHSVDPGLTRSQPPLSDKPNMQGLSELSALLASPPKNDLPPKLPVRSPRVGASADPQKRPGVKMQEKQPEGAPPSLPREPADTGKEAEGQLERSEAENRGLEMAIEELMSQLEQSQNELAKRDAVIARQADELFSQRSIASQVGRMSAELDQLDAWRAQQAELLERVAEERIGHIQEVLQMKDSLEHIHAQLGCIERQREDIGIRYVDLEARLSESSAAVLPLVCATSELSPSVDRAAAAERQELLERIRKQDDTIARLEAQVAEQRGLELLAAELCEMSVQAKQEIASLRSRCASLEGNAVNESPTAASTSQESRPGSISMSKWKSSEELALDAVVLSRASATSLPAQLHAA